MTASTGSDKNLFSALAKCQGEFGPVHFDSSAQARGGKYRYASLSAIWNTVRPVLSRHGIAVVQLPIVAGSGRVGLRTIITHESGESIESLADMPAGDTPQACGSAYTYLRRYSIAAALGIVAEEDDDAQTAQAAVGKPVAKQKPKTLLQFLQDLGVSPEEMDKAGALCKGHTPSEIQGWIDSGLRWDRETETFQPTK